MDCDIYVRAELEMEAAFREAKYKVIGDYVNKEKYMVNPMAPKIHIKIFHKEKTGKIIFRKNACHINQTFSNKLLY